MKLDNAKRAGIIKLIYMLIPLLVVAAIAVIYLVYDLKNLGLMAIAIGVLLFFFLVMAVFRLNYIIFYAGPNKITILYKTLSPFKSASNSVKIKATEFRSYKLKTSLGGIKKTLYLSLETPSGMAKYPGIGLSSLKKDEIANVTKALDLIIKINSKIKKT